MFVCCSRSSCCSSSPAPCSTRRPARWCRRSTPTGSRSTSTTIGIATGIFLVGFVAAVLYLVRAGWEITVEAGRTPTRFPVTLGSRLPAADVLDRMAYRTVAFGFPVWTFGIIAGAIWAEAAWGRYWGWDPKETWAFITWVVYAAYLHARATAGWRGTAAAAGQHGRVRDDDLQLLHHQHGGVRSALVCRFELNCPDKPFVVYAGRPVTAVRRSRTRGGSGVRSRASV